MSYKDTTYVIFDADNDRWAYSYMRGWRSRDHIDFDFDDAHDIFPLTYRAQDELYIKGRLLARLQQARQVLVLVGESTRYLYKYVRWEIDTALLLNLPVIVVNLNNSLDVDEELLPPILRGRDILHIPFKMAAIRHALDDFPPFFRRTSENGPWVYDKATYRRLNIL
ncbi:MAG: TIR domain-containing protein [Bacteroidota bacterium]|nr:TIR domain-containing protein [Bacteroidota bacterium]